MAQRNPPAAKVSAFGMAAWEVQLESDTEISTHNHETNNFIFDSYREAKFISIPSQVHREFGLLTDMKTSTSNINRFLSKQLDGSHFVSPTNKKYSKASTGKYDT
ncbi:hypothetical protein F441_10782 [Phytophthora nicotianae CJ01A1]|uniref:Uncharacterized protein n=1 Tax=Phytophthora nicotianae CJ01A1 TaxID=1317063 RepID=W2WUT2_PHYNI|nr:hypothetical protein F441_10782 [Phytophthora nicotianae CJ01A1]